MKRKLLLFILPLLFLATIGNAQTKVWDFGNDTTHWPLSTGIGNAEMVVDGLGLYPILTNTNFGAITASVSAFSDGYTTVNRFQMNGGGTTSANPGAFLPTQRYVYFTVDGACTVKVWFKTGSNGATRKVMCTNGTVLLGSGTSNDTATGGVNGDLVIFTATVSAANALGNKIYIYGDTTANNLYKIEVTGANITTPPVTLNNFQAEQNSVNVFSNGNQISVANVKSDSKIEVYNMAGSLVKAMTTSADVNFNIETSGFYIVNVESAEGKKSVKVTVK